MVHTNSHFFRHSTRLRNYDYSHPGAYFVTICTSDRKWEFGHVVDGRMVLNEAGHIVQSIWQSTPDRFPTVVVEEYIIMPNHVHGIFRFTAPISASRDVPFLTRIPGRFQRNASAFDQDSAQSPSPSQSSHQPADHTTVTLGSVVRTLKGASTHTIRRQINPDFAWQSRYYDTILRDEKSHERIRQYIIDNPKTWTQDTLYHCLQKRPRNTIMNNMKE